MTVISDDNKKPRNEVSGLLVDNEEDSQDSNSNDNNNNEISNSQIIMDQENDINEDNDLVFHVDVMKRLIDLVNKQKWVVPVLPGGDLEMMLLVSISYAYLKKDEEVEHFKELYKKGLLVSFERILTDEAVLNWKLDILDSIYRNSIIMLKLCALKLNDDNLPILDILALILNPDAKYYCSNVSTTLSQRVNLLENFESILKKYKPEIEKDENEVSEIEQEDEEEDEVNEEGDIKDSDQLNPVDAADSTQVLANITDNIDNFNPLNLSQELPLLNEQKYSRCHNNQRSKVIYSDFINCFGHFDGFLNLKNRFDRFDRLDQPDVLQNLTVLLSLLKPIAFCVSYLTDETRSNFISPIAEKAVKLILSLNVESIKPDIIKEWKSDPFSNIIQYLETIIRHTQPNDTYINQLAVFRLNIILKVLQHAPFNGRMNALNELNKLIKSIYTTYSSKDRFNYIIKWIKDNEVLSIVLKENLHQPQYVEKVERLIRFMVKAESLSNEDLDRLWDSQIGKHEAIVTNIHDLLAKLAYDFSPTQLQHLFDCFQKSWVKASKRQRERLIDLIRRLAEEDKDGRMAKTALTLLWDLATQIDSPLDIMESALRAHAKILDFCSNQDREASRNEWLKKLICYLSNNENQKNSVSTLRQIKEIIKLFQLPQPTSYNSTTPRCKIIEKLDSEHNLLSLITNNLVDYVKNFRNNQSECDQTNDVNPVDSRFPHDIQIDERLDILKFLLNEGEGCIQFDAILLTKIWNCLVLQESDSSTIMFSTSCTENISTQQQQQINPHNANLPQYIYSDRDQCFKWLACLMEFDNRPFDYIIIEQFFEEHFLKLDPKLLTLNGILLFELLFRIINQSKGNLVESEVINRELVGLEYLWRCAMFCVDEEVFTKILHLLKSIFTYLGGSLSRLDNNSDFIQHCIQILQSAFDTAQCLLSQTPTPTVKSSDPNNIKPDHVYEVSQEMQESVNKLANIIQILCEFIRECDNRFYSERKNPAMCLITYGQQYLITVSFNNTFSRNNNIRHFDVEVHSNELLKNLRQNIENQLKEFQRNDNNFELFRSGTESLLDERDNYKTLSQLGLVDGSIIQARLTTFQTKPLNKITEDISEKEDDLPGVQISKTPEYMKLIINIGDLSLKLNNEKLRWSVNHLLNLLPPDEQFKNELIDAVLQDDNNKLDKLLRQQSPMKTVYLINVLFSLLLPCHLNNNADLSVQLLSYLLKNNALRTFMTMLHFDDVNYLNVFIPKSCETGCSIRLLGLMRLMKIMYLLLSMLLRLLLHCHQISPTNNFKLDNHTLQAFKIFEENRHYWTVPSHIINEKYEQSYLRGYLEAILASQPVNLLNCLPQRKDIDSIMKLCWCCCLSNRLEMMSLDIRKFQDYFQQLTMERSKSLMSFNSTITNNNNNNNNNNATANTTSRNILNTSASITTSFTTTPDILYNSNTNSDTSANNMFSLNTNMLTSSSSCTSPIVGLTNVTNTTNINTVSTTSYFGAPEIIKTNQPTLCALECLSLVIAASLDTNILDLIKEKYTKDFISIILLHSRSSQVRQKSAEEIRFILRFSDNSKALEHVIQMLFTKLHNVNENPLKYGDVYGLVVRLLSDLHHMQTQLSNTEPIMKTQIDRLLETKSLQDNAPSQVRANHEVLLVGRLNIIRELMRFFGPTQKVIYNNQYLLIDVLLDNFLFPSSKRHSEIKQYQQEQLSNSSISHHHNYHHQHMDNNNNTNNNSNNPNYSVGSSNCNNNNSNNREFPIWATAPLLNPICNTPDSQKAAFELLKVLVAGSQENMTILCKKLDKFFYNDNRFYLSEWDYKPSFITRSATGFVGLKNAGATCYMNSILQQLFMIAPIRSFLLGVDAGPPISHDDYDDNLLYNVRKDLCKRSSDSKTNKLDVLREVQMIFGNLAFSKNQFFTPTGFWRHFKFWGDEVNLREQHDALEFFTCLVDSLDEALHSIGMSKIFEEVLVGQFADQKICKGCPHRYECEEKFFQLSVDIRNHENLTESLEQYVKGDLLEGDNAYFCESCQLKRDTVKRTCIKKLPLVLAIQLKRFDYDWERETSVKFNDYFEFPNELDMAPYTVAGTSKRDHLNSINEIVHCPMSPDDEADDEDRSEDADPNSLHSSNISSTAGSSGSNCTRYVLKGVVVHGGQASGGHYYSYIRERRKFDNGSNTANDTGFGSNINSNIGCSSVGNPGIGVNSGINTPNIIGCNNQMSGSTSGSINGTNIGTTSSAASATNIHENNSLDLLGDDSNPANYCWYRFDDTEVTEVRMDSEEMKNQWFGGDFVGESYDHVVKRVSMRRQKRWWSAYILFYEREDFPNQHASLAELQQGNKVVTPTNMDIDTPVSATAPTGILTQSDIVSSSSSNTATITDIGSNITPCIPRLPRHIEQNITLQNIEYSHTKTQYTVEYFSFLRELPCLVIPSQELLPVKLDHLDQTKEELEKMKKVVASIMSKFLFSIGFKTVRTIRGPANVWIDNLKLILHDCEKARLEFCINAVFWPLTKITEFFFESTNPEIRQAYTTLIRLICHWSLRDNSITPAGYLSSEWQRDHRMKDIYQFMKDRYPFSHMRLRLSHILMSIVYLLLNKDTNEHGAASNEYLSIFYDYPAMGFPELSHCLDINLGTHILKFCLDEYFPSPGTSRLEITKLLCSFCRLMRCYDLDNTSNDIHVEMLIPNANALTITYPLQPQLIATDNGGQMKHCLYLDPQTPCYKIRKIPEHLWKYLFQRTQKFMKKVIEDFYNDSTKEEFNKFLKFMSFNNYSCTLSIIESLSHDLVCSFIRNIKSFMELFRAIIDINDDLRLKRAVIMLESDQLDYVVRFKPNSERRSYFIMKMIMFSVSKLNDAEKRQLWDIIQDHSCCKQKLEKALDNLNNVLHQSSQHPQHSTHPNPHQQRNNKAGVGTTTNPASTSATSSISPIPTQADNISTGVSLMASNLLLTCSQAVNPVIQTSSIDSNEDCSGNAIERTESTEFMETVGSDLLKIYDDIYPPTQSVSYDEIELINQDSSTNPSADLTEQMDQLLISNNQQVPTNNSGDLPDYQSTTATASSSNYNDNNNNNNNNNNSNNPDTD